jgi:hypothetical protein
VEQTLAARPEGALRDELLREPATAATALTLIRLQELHQQHTPLASRLIRALVTFQQSDGGWGDVATTALALRALMGDRGQGLTIERGLAYLANLQKTDEPIWPNVPMRRMPADALVSAFLLHQLSGFDQFRSAVRFGQAVAWFERNESVLDGPTLRLWQRVRLRLPAGHCEQPMLIAA